jgi:hypothetical protein
LVKIPNSKSCQKPAKLKSQKSLVFSAQEFLKFPKSNFKFQNSNFQIPEKPYRGVFPILYRENLSAIVHAAIRANFPLASENHWLFCDFDNHRLVVFSTTQYMMQPLCQALSN